MDFVNICGQSFFETPVTGGDFLSFELLKNLPNANKVYLIINDITFSYARASLKCNILPVKDFFNLNKLVQKHISLVPLAFINSFIKIMGYLKNFKGPLILYSSGDFICNVLPMVMYKNKFSGSKVIVRIYHLNESPFTRRGNSFFSSLVSFFLQGISLILIKRKADLILLLNNGVRDALIKTGFSPERLVVIGTGVDVKKINIAKNIKRENKIIFLGRLSRTKGIFDLPEILAQVLKQVPDAKLLLIGFSSKKIENELKGEFFKAGILNNVNFMGYMEEKNKIYEIMNKGKVFILPSYEEGWSIAVFEAIACGLAPIVYDLPVFSEIFGDDITKVSRGDFSAFAEKAINFLKDEKTREDRNSALRRRIEPYDLSNIIRKEIGLIENVSNARLAKVD